MTETDAENRNTGAGGTTGSESGTTTGAGGTTGNEETGAGFDAPATDAEGADDKGGGSGREDTGAGFDLPAAGGGGEV